MATKNNEVDERDRLLTMFFECVAAELIHARQKFPQNFFMTAALGEEVGELCNALLETQYKELDGGDIVGEAIQVAAMAARICFEGSDEFDFVFDPILLTRFDRRRLLGTEITRVNNPNEKTRVAEAVESAEFQLNKDAIEVARDAIWNFELAARVPGLEELGEHEIMDPAAIADYIGKIVRGEDLEATADEPDPLCPECFKLKPLTIPCDFVDPDGPQMVCSATCWHDAFNKSGTPAATTPQEVIDAEQLEAEADIRRPSAIFERRPPMFGSVGMDQIVEQAVDNLKDGLPIGGTARVCDQCKRSFNGPAQVDAEHTFCGVECRKAFYEKKSPDASFAAAVKASPTFPESSDINGSWKQQNIDKIFELAQALAYKQTASEIHIAIADIRNAFETEPF